MTLFYVVVLIASVGALIYMFRAQSKNKKDDAAGQSENYSSISPSYPYRPGIEYRLPDGRITTKGYAASHPSEFTHWCHGPENVYGECIDRNDWEDWRANYYGD